jgi:hypothetical protein
VVFIIQPLFAILTSSSKLLLATENKVAHVI